MGDASGLHSNKNYLASIMNLLNHPFKSILFALSLVGNIFVPASRFEPELPVAFGALFIIIACIFLWFGRKKIRIDDIFLNQSCLLGGTVFLVIVYLSRFSADNNAIAAVAAPRYVTGSMIFIIGLLGIVQKINSTKLFRIILLIFSLLIFSSGLKTGLEWHSVRYGQSSYFVKCLKDKETYSFQPGGFCYNLLLREGYASNLYEYNKLLENFLVKNKD